MDRNFPRALKLVLAHEGGWSNHPDDKGGPTMRGITIATYRRFINAKGTADDLKRISDKEVADIYRRQYWAAVKGDELPDGLDYAVFDFAVNSGPGRAIKYLQAAAGVAQDGKLGPITLAIIARTPTAKIVNSLCDARLAFLRKLKTWNTFGKGWNARVKECRQEALIMIAAAPQKPAESVQPSEPVQVPPTPQPAPVPVPEPKGTYQNDTWTMDVPQVPADPWWKVVLKAILAVLWRKK